MSPAKKATRNKRKTTNVSTTAVTKIPQPGGRGALNSGGTPGNRGGTGRPPSEVKARALKAFDATALPELERLATQADKDSDRIAAANVLAKAGFSDGISRAEVRKALAATVAIFRDNLSPDEADALLAAIKPLWSAL